MEFIDQVRFSASALDYTTGGGAGRNTRVGHRAGAGVLGMRNVYVGSRTGDAPGTRGDDNVVVGCDAMRDLPSANSSTVARNVVVGARSSARSSGCVVLGADNDVAARNVVCIGNDRVVTRPDSVVLGGVGHTSFDICDRLVEGDRVRGEVGIAGDARVAGAVACRKLELEDHWQARVSPGDARDLLLVSSHGSVVSFCDSFAPGVLNFTGQHHCVADDPASLRPGLVVVATGRYANLDGSSTPTVDEAVPVVALSTAHADPRVFGVVSRVVDGDDLRMAVGHLAFELRGAGHRRVVVNSVGEGGVWVCDSDGPIRTGDLLCTSESIPGHCCRQDDDIVRAHTVCKATCDATFTEDSPTCFIGCTFLL